MHRTVVIYYRTEHGIINIERDFESIEDLNDALDRQPGRGDIEKIKIRYGSFTLEGKLAEEAAKK